MKNKVRQKLPKWFEGEVYEIGDEVCNPFSGEKYFLTAEELSMYDTIKSAEIAAHMLGFNEDLIDVIQKGIDWFRKENPKAYMILLD